MHKSATKCNKTLGKWCKNKHGASKIIDTLETYQRITPSSSWEIAIWMEMAVEAMESMEMAPVALPRPGRVPEQRLLSPEIGLQ
jgi:hypothetical protein